MSDDEFIKAAGLERNSAGELPLIYGIMPGSRRGEIREIADVMFLAARWIEKELQDNAPAIPVNFVVPLAHEELRPELERAARRAGLTSVRFMQPGHTYDLLALAAVMIVKSGTGLHQCVLMNTPAVMCYRVHGSVAALLRLMRFSMPFYGLPNLIAGREVVPELIQEKCTEGNIAREVFRLTLDRPAIEKMRADFAELREKLCRSQPLQQIARAVQALLPR